MLAGASSRYRPTLGGNPSRRSAMARTERRAAPGYTRLVPGGRLRQDADMPAPPPQIASRVIDMQVNRELQGEVVARAACGCRDFHEIGPDPRSHITHERNQPAPAGTWSVPGVHSSGRAWMRSSDCPKLRGTCWCSLVRGERYREIRQQGSICSAEMLDHDSRHLAARTGRIPGQGMMARQAGFEPATRCLEGSRSIRLSYWRSVTIVQGKDHVLATRGSQCRAARCHAR